MATMVRFACFEVSACTAKLGLPLVDALSRCLVDAGFLPAGGSGSTAGGLLSYSATAELGVPTAASIALQTAARVATAGDLLRAGATASHGKAASAGGNGKTFAMFGLAGVYLYGLDDACLLLSESSNDCAASGTPKKPLEAGKSADDQAQLPSGDDGNGGNKRRVWGALSNFILDALYEKYEKLQKVWAEQKMKEERLFGAELPREAERLAMEEESILKKQANLLRDEEGVSKEKENIRRAKENMAKREKELATKEEEMKKKLYVPISQLYYQSEHDDSKKKESWIKRKLPKSFREAISLFRASKENLGMVIGLAYAGCERLSEPLGHNLEVGMVVSD